MSTAPGAPVSDDVVAGVDRHGARRADARVEPERGEALGGQQDELREVVVEALRRRRR